VEGLVKAATAAVSLVAAYSLWPVIPNALAIPGLDGLRDAKEQVDKAVAEREALISGLTAANRDLNDFAHSVAHDLRGPLRSINGFSQLLTDEYGEQLDSCGHEMLDRVRLASLHMSRLIDDLLFLARIRQVPLAKSSADLSEMERSIHAELREETPNRSVETVVADGLVAKCDRELMRIALKHLLENAWKFTSKNEDARIEFGGEIKDKETTIRVRDNGVGFDMAYADKLFLPFQRLHRPDEFAGNGIGLAIVWRIIQRHGCHIDTESSPAKGTLFTISL